MKKEIYKKKDMRKKTKNRIQIIDELIIIKILKNLFDY